MRNRLAAWDESHSDVLAPMRIVKNCGNNRRTCSPDHVGWVCESALSLSRPPKDLAHHQNTGFVSHRIVGHFHAPRCVLHLRPIRQSHTGGADQHPTLLIQTRCNNASSQILQHAPERTTPYMQINCAT